MSLFDFLHEQMFDQLFALDEASRQQLAQIARDQGASEEVVQQLLAPGIKAGVTFGAAHPIDVKFLVERALFRQGAVSITLKISRWEFDEAGHLDIRILEIQPATESDHGPGHEPSN